MLTVLALAADASPRLNVPMLMALLLAFGLLAAWASRAMCAPMPKRRPRRPLRREVIGGRLGRPGDPLARTPARSSYWLN